MLEQQRIVTADFEFGLPRGATLYQLLNDWLRTEKRCEPRYTGLHFADYRQEGGLQAYVPGYPEELNAKLYWWTAEKPSAYHVRLHNHRDLIREGSRWNTEAFGKWLESYLKQRGIEYTVRYH